MLGLLIHRLMLRKFKINWKRRNGKLLTRKFRLRSWGGWRSRFKVVRIMFRLSLLHIGLRKKIFKLGLRILAKLIKILMSWKNCPIAWVCLICMEEREINITLLKINYYSLNFPTFWTVSLHIRRLLKNWKNQNRR